MVDTGACARPRRRAPSVPNGTEAECPHGLHFCMSSVVLSDRNAIAEPKRRADALGSPPDDHDARTHALVYRGPGRRAWEERPHPVLQDPTDAIVRITTSTICGTDLHILKGDVPSVTAGRILGHEGVGVVTEVGPGVSTFRRGDRVLISCITSCGRCDFCRKQMYSHCRHGGQR
jgi:hypothetical protein